MNAEKYNVNTNYSDIKYHYSIYCMLLSDLSTYGCKSKLIRKCCKYVSLAFELEELIIATSSFESYLNSKKNVSLY